MEESRITGHDDRGEPCHALARLEKVFIYTAMAAVCVPWIVGGYFLWRW